MARKPRAGVRGDGTAFVLGQTGLQALLELANTRDWIYQSKIAEAIEASPNVIQETLDRLVGDAHLEVQSGPMRARNETRLYRLTERGREFARRLDWAVEWVEGKRPLR